MSIKRVAFAVIAGAAAVLASAPLSATTYVGTHSVGDGTLNLSITTDNSVGILTQANITDWSFLMTNPGGSVTLDSANSLFTYFSGTALSATANELIFDFSGTGHMQWDNFGSGGNDAYCMDTVGAAATCVGSPPGQYLYVNATLSTESRTGRFVLGTQLDSAVPEPSTWAMMLFGFGGVGLAMRRRKPKQQLLNAPC